MPANPIIFDPLWNVAPPQKFAYVLRLGTYSYRKDQAEANLLAVMSYLVIHRVVDQQMELYSKTD